MNNNGFRLLHASDVHLGVSGSRRALEKLLAFSRTEDVDVVIIAGDLFDSNRVDKTAMTFAVKKLESFQIPLLILPGNHDPLVEDSVYRRSEIISLNHKIKVFIQPTGETFTFPTLDLAVWGRPLCDYGGRFHPLSGIPPRGQERWQIAVAHGQIVGGDAFPFDRNCSFPITMDEVINCDRDYVALGHWPTACCLTEGSTTAYYAGSATELGTFLTVDFKLGQPPDVTVHHI